MTTTHADHPAARSPLCLSQLPGERISELLPTHPWVVHRRPSLPRSWSWLTNCSHGKHARPRDRRSVGLLGGRPRLDHAGQAAASRYDGLRSAGDPPGTRLTLVKRRTVRRYLPGGDEFTDVLDLKLRDGRPMTTVLYMHADHAPGRCRAIAWNDLAIAAVIVPADVRWRPTPSRPVRL